jgi:hypothetical protein
VLYILSSYVSLRSSVLPCDVRDDLRKKTMLVSSLSSVFVGGIIRGLDCITIMFDSICHISNEVYVNF